MAEASWNKLNAVALLLWGALEYKRALTHSVTHHRPDNCPLSKSIMNHSLVAFLLLNLHWMISWKKVLNGNISSNMSSFRAAIFYEAFSLSDGIIFPRDSFIKSLTIEGGKERKAFRWTLSSLSFTIIISHNLNGNDNEPRMIIIITWRANGHAIGVRPRRVKRDAEALKIQ